MKKFLFIYFILLTACQTTKENVQSLSTPAKPKQAGLRYEVFESQKLGIAQPTREQVLAFANQKIATSIAYESMFPEQVVLADWAAVHQTTQANLQANSQTSDYASRVAHVSIRMIRSYLLAQPQPLSNDMKQALNYYITELDRVAQYTPAFVDALPTLRNYRSNQDLRNIANRAIARLQSQNQGVQTVSTTASNGKATRSNWSNMESLALDAFIGATSQHQSLITSLQTFVASL